MTCSRCDGEFDADAIPGGPIWCPTCVAAVCCARQRALGRICEHTPRRGRRTSRFARSAIAAAAFMVSACTTSPGGGVDVAMPSTTDRPVPRVPSSVPSRERLAAEYSARSMPPRASRSQTTARPRATVPTPVTRPAVVAQHAAGTATYEQLDALAGCESGRDPRKNTGNGFFGAFQFKLSTWHGMGMPGNPIDYSYETQRDVARRIPLSAWHSQFPGCSRKLGIR